MKCLKERIREGEIVNFTTDKSGKMCVDDPSNYITGMQPHIQESVEVTGKDYQDIEKTINAHMNSWCNIIKADVRVRSAMQASNNGIPPQYGLRKDHKDFDDLIKGPPLRPVCGAVSSCNYRISYFLSIILKPFITLAEEACNSTEDMLWRINKCNAEVDLRNSMVGSFDVDALYPSIDVDFSIEKCMELILENEFQYKNFDILEVVLYLSIMTEKEERIKEGIDKFCPSRGVGRPPTITSSGGKSNYKKRWQGWKKPDKVPDDNMKKKLFVRALGVVLKVVLNNHVFSFNLKNYKQMKGGAIGVSVAGDVACLFMVWWDRELKKRLQEKDLNFQLYSRYVDDGNIVIQKVAGTLNEEDGETEKRTMELVKEIANDIHSSIKVKVDYPSKHESKRLPMLDMELWIEKVEIDGEMKYQLLYSHYMKAVSSRFVIHNNSAISSCTKINILVNDLIRVMKNISPHVKKEERNRHIQYYMYRLQFSGYSKEDRIKVYRKAKKRFDEMIRDSTIGDNPIYRSKFWKLNERQKEKENKKNTWYKKKGFKSTFFVNATPNERLSLECQKVLNEVGLPIKVIEKSGKTIKSHLMKSDPFKNKECEDETCPVCSGDNRINCKTRDVVYELKCKTCSENYVGETSDSIKERTSEHLYACRMRSKDSVFYKHFSQKHNGNENELQIEILGRCSGDAMLRQCMESVAIRDKEPSLNSREEWGGRNVTHGRRRIDAVNSVQCNDVNGMTSTSVN